MPTTLLSPSGSARRRLHRDQGGVKLASGFVAPWRRFNRLSVGLGMMPRGEVGLIFAGIGLAGGVFSHELFGAVVIMVIGTTLLAPPLLKWSFSRFGLTDSEGKKMECRQ